MCEFGSLNSAEDHIGGRPKGHVFLTTPRAQNRRFYKIINFRVFHHFWVLLDLIKKEQKRDLDTPQKTSRPAKAPLPRPRNSPPQLRAALENGTQLWRILEVDFWPKNRLF